MEMEKSLCLEALLATNCYLLQGIYCKLTNIIGTNPTIICARVCEFEVALFGVRRFFSFEMPFF